MTVYNQNPFTIQPYRVYKTLTWDSTRTVCFTGHRPPKIGGYNPNPTADFIYNTILNFVRNNIHTFDTYISGMALGVDTLGAMAVLTCKYTNELPVRLITAAPYPGQEIRWLANSKKTWKDIIDYADLNVEVSAPVNPMDGRDATRKLLHRNLWMLHHSSLCYAVWNGDTKGGTYHCLTNARRMGMKEFVLAV
jgi:uncharacterized phage-like protein YoqJ